MFLSDRELEDLTGYRAPSAQIRWLKLNGWRFVLNRMGQPRVARAYCETRLGVKSAERTDEPHWEVLSATTPKGRQR